jgi:hypothetical protein
MDLYIIFVWAYILLTQFFVDANILLMPIFCKRLYFVDTIERLGLSHLYPSGEHPEDKHVVCLRQESNPSRLRHRRALYLKSYPDSLLIAIRNYYI